MAPKSLRDEWVKAKADAGKTFDMSKLVDKRKFGPKLDKYESTRAAYEKLATKLATNPDDKKEKAAKDAVKRAAVDARDAADQYVLALTDLKKHTNDAATDRAADELRNHLYHLVDVLTKVAKGNFNAIH